jgi:hypothetical protein
MPARRNGSIAVWRLANNVSPFLFRKADWHGLRTIWDSYKVESVKTLQTADVANQHWTFQASIPLTL